MPNHYNPDLHHRRSIRLRHYDYSQNGAYFVTLCIQNRECLFGEITESRITLNEYGKVTTNSWNWLSERYAAVDLDAWIVMPNHLHGVILFSEGAGNGLGLGGSRTAPTKEETRKPLGRVIGAFKTVSTKRINELRSTPTVPVWQRNYYEHVIRNDNDLARIREYIADNPAGWADDESNPANIRTPS